MRRFSPFLVVLALALPLAGRAEAHGHREVGDHGWTVGWAAEPAFAGQPNAVQLLLEHENGEPAEGAEKDLKVTVSVGDAETEPLQLRTVFDSPGEYRADIIPTVPGDYTFHFTGEIQGVKVDETFTASKDDFSLIEGTGDLAFPKQAPTNTELAERLENIQRTANDAKDAITLPRVAAIVGVVLALVAIALAARPRRGSS
ncbi:MAG TPA: hypothetical protein VFA34_08015 [Actinomycetota bacterium]|jgi:hypothetical protein|nr:hypothetical protein [Actinomycetota bacterium]